MRFNLQVRSIKQQIYEIIEPAAKGDIYSKVFDTSLMTLILLNLFAVILSSFSVFYIRWEQYLILFEYFSVGLFTIEYILRLWTSNKMYPTRSYLLAVILYATSFIAIIDLAAILPFFLPFVTGLDLRFLRILRLLRLARLLKLQRYTDSFNIMIAVFARRKEELLTTLFLTILLIFTASSLMYFFESEAQPLAFPNIIATLWWAVSTLTTVGYGDVYPITAAGKILSSLIAILGIGLVALPTAIISTGFLEELTARRSTKKKSNLIICPHCSKEIDKKAK